MQFLFLFLGKIMTLHFLNNITLQKPEVTNFAEIIKIASTLMKTVFNKLMKL